MDYMSDGAAVKAAQNGDRAAFGWLVQRHQRRALAVALGMLHHKEDALDACQEAFLRAFRALDSFDGTAQFSTWLHRIVMNICIDKWRLKSNPAVALDDVEDLLAGDDDPARTVEGAQLGGQIGAALAQLTANHRTALVLREWQGLSYQEIADVMKCSIGTVMSRLFHARKKLQAILLRQEPALTMAA